MTEMEEEVGCSWNHMVKKGAHMYHHFVMSSSQSFGEVIHNSPRVARISWWDEPCELCFGHNSQIVACIF